MNLRISDYMVDIPPKPDLDYQETLIVAMNREKASFKLYNDLADTTDDKSLQTTFLALAQEEAKHKSVNRFRIEAILPVASKASLRGFPTITTRQLPAARHPQLPLRQLPTEPSRAVGLSSDLGRVGAWIECRKACLE